MPLSFLPKIIAPSLTSLDAPFLKSQGIRLLMLDFDNTIVPYTTDVPTQEMDTWLRYILSSDIRLCVVSNTKKTRAPAFCEKYAMDIITHAGKPFGDGIKKCLQKYGIPPKECALVGDQIYTDTLGANLNGVRSILIPAIHNHNFWLKLRHIAELPFIFFARKRRMKK